MKTYQSLVEAYDNKYPALAFSSVLMDKRVVVLEVNPSSELSMAVNIMVGLPGTNPVSMVAHSASVRRNVGIEAIVKPQPNATASALRGLRVNIRDGIYKAYLSANRDPNKMLGYLNRLNPPMRWKFIGYYNVPDNLKDKLKPIIHMTGWVG